jgi:hypothetical protein
LNFTDLQRGHSRRTQIRCGTQSGQIQFIFLIVPIPASHLVVQATVLSRFLSSGAGVKSHFPQEHATPHDTKKDTSCGAA